jgi:hypothetical protein
VTLEKMLKEIYESEVNINISSFWDSGYTFRLEGLEYHTYDFRMGLEWAHRRAMEKVRKR